MAAKSQSTTSDTTTQATTTSETSSATSAVSQKRGNQAEQEKLETEPGSEAPECEMDDTSLALQLDAMECYDFGGAVELALDHVKEPAAHAWMSAQDPATVASATPSFWDTVLRALPDGGSVSVGGKLEAVFGLSQGGVKESASAALGLNADLGWMGEAFTLTATLAANVGAGVEGTTSFLTAIGVDAASLQLTGTETVTASWSFTKDDVLDAALDLAWTLLVSGGSTLAAYESMAATVVRNPPSEWRIEAGAAVNGAATMNVPTGDGLLPELGEGVGAQATVAGSVGLSSAVGQDANGPYTEVAVSASGSAQVGIAQDYGLTSSFFSAFPPASGTVGASLRVYADSVTLASGEVLDAPARISITHGTTTDSVMVENAAEARAWLAELTASLPDSLQTGGDLAEDAALPDGGITRTVSAPIKDAAAIAPWVPEVAAQLGNFSGTTEVLDNSLSTSMVSKVDASVTVTDDAVEAAMGGQDTGESRYAVASAIADTALGRPAADTAANMTAGFGKVRYDAATVTLELAGEAKITKEAMEAILTGDVAPLAEVAADSLKEAATGSEGGASEEANTYLNQKTTKVFDLTQRVPQVELPDVLAAAAK